MAQSSRKSPGSSLSIPIRINPSPADGAPGGPGYVRVAVPLARSRFRRLPGIAIATPQGAIVPHQAETIARWPDGSIRVVLLTFAGAAGTYRLTVGGPVKSPPIKAAIACKARRDGAVEIRTGRLTAIVGGRTLIESVHLGRKQLLGQDGIQLLAVDGQARGFASAGPDRTEIEAAGDLRTVIAMHGRHTLAGETFIDYRLRLEFLAGCEGFSLAYTFFNRQSGADFVALGALQLDLKMAAAAHPQHVVYQRSHGLFSTMGRVVRTPQPLDIAVDDTRMRAYVSNTEALGDEIDYPFYLNPPCKDIENWAAISDDDRCLLVEMDDFDLLRPKSLVVSAGTARFGVWPRQAGTLSLQQGRSREVTIRVVLGDQGPPTTPGAAAAATAAMRDVWRAQVPQQAFADTAFFDQHRVLTCEPHRHPRFENWLGSMAGGLESVATFFDLGDTPDSGYRTTYIPIGGRIRRVRGEDGGQRWFSTGLHNPATALNNLDDFEPVWVNNEYDVVYALGTEFLRSGDLSVFRKLRWWSRHTIDVDFVHYSEHQWLHRAQPAHSERHTTTGAYPSHFWTQGLAQYYMLTGDPDALEVIVALAQKTIENFEDPILRELNSGLNREIGWGILTLVCAFEASGDRAFDGYARQLIDQEMGYGLPADLPLLSFGHVSILLGVRQYLQVHQGEADLEAIRKWFCQFVDFAIACARQAPEPRTTTSPAKAAYSYDAVFAARGGAGQHRSGIVGGTHSLGLDALAYAWELSGDPSYIEAGLPTVDLLLDSIEFRQPRHEGKPFAMVYRTYINFLGAAAQLGLLTQFEYPQRPRRGPQ